MKRRLMKNVDEDTFWWVVSSLLMIGLTYYLAEVRNVNFETLVIALLLVLYVRVARPLRLPTFGPEGRAGEPGPPGPMGIMGPPGRPCDEDAVVNRVIDEVLRVMDQIDGTVTTVDGKIVVRSTDTGEILGEVRNPSPQEKK